MRALVLVAHGSRDPRQAEVVASVAGQVAALLPDVTVTTGALDHDSPRLDAALAAAAAAHDEVVVVPLLLSGGQHADVDVPAAVAALGPATRVRTAGALGPHALLAQVLRERVTAAGVPADDPSWGVVVGGVGSHDPAGTDDVAVTAQLLASMTSWRTQAGFLGSALPTLAGAAEALRRSGAERVALVPYTLAGGMLPDRVGVAPDMDVVAEPLGDHPHLARLVVARYAYLHGLVVSVTDPIARPDTIVLSDLQEVR